MELLRSSSYLRNKYLTAIGKAEWADIKWNDHSIADKRDIINNADLVFVAAHTPAAYQRAYMQLSADQVNCRLLDCSDAHALSGSADVNRIGNCFTWIKADPTFIGLCQAVQEFDGRVHVADQPPKFRQVELNPSKYIRSVRICRASGCSSKFDEDWFDNDLMLNHDLVAVVGNKGSGKSALADIIALLSNTKRQEFSFLTDDKFRKRKKAQNFEATITWESGMVQTRNLQSDVAAHAQELVRYIPQRFFEQVCNEIASGDAKDFEAELKAVIFSRVSEAMRLQCSTLDDLISYRSQEINRQLQQKRDELRQLNGDILELERLCSPDSRQQMVEQLNTKQRQLADLEAAAPTPVEQPDRDAAADRSLSELRKQQQTVDSEIERTEERYAAMSKTKVDIENLDLALDRYEQQYRTFLSDYRALASSLSLNIDALVQITIDRGPLHNRLSAVQGEIVPLEHALDERTGGSPAADKHRIAAEIARIQASLDDAGQKYQRYLNSLREWELAKKRLIGDTETPDSLEYIKKRLHEAEHVLPAQLLAARSRRLDKVREIYGSIQQLAALYEELYAPVQRFIDEDEVVRSEYNLNFRVQITDTSFAEQFLHYIDLGNRGSFLGADDGVKRIRYSGPRNLDSRNG